MKKGDICTGTVETVLFPGRGIVCIEGHTALVKNTIRGQQIRFRIKKKRNGSYDSILLDVLQPSPEETEDALCSLYPDCGGCLYRTLPYEKQLEMKREQMLRLFRPILGTDSETVFEGIKGSPLENAYRNKMEYSFGDSEKDGPLTLGLHRRGSMYDILTAADCRIVHEDFNRIVTAALDFCRKRSWTYYHRRTHMGFLRHLLVRRAHMTGEILVDLVTSSQYDPGEEEYRTFARKLLALPVDGRIVGILHTVNDSLADIVQNERTEILWGSDCFTEHLLGLQFRVTPFSFFQTNSAGAEVLYETAREFLGDVRNKTVFDLYSGTGTIAQMLAPVTERVIGVEIVEEAVEAARLNARINGLQNCRFIAGDVLKVLDSIEEKPDVIVLDPPRDGIHPKALPRILAYGVPRIVYISCKPTSLVRDLEVFIKEGYRVQRMVCVDMFPATVHVESVVKLTRAGL